MTKFPQLLAPTGHFPISLPSGASIAVPCCRPMFSEWRGSGFRYGNKQLLDFEGEGVFAEIYILELLRSCGWDGVWAQSFGGRKYVRQMPNSWELPKDYSLPDKQQALMDKIDERAATSGGLFDVFAWADDQILFCESKRQRKDSIRPTQRIWLEAALASGLKPENFLIVEWNVRL